MVHSDDWPIHEFANTTVVPFTYAIDKWEAYLSSGSITNGTPGGCALNSCVSTTTGVLSSASGQTQSVSMDWYATRKGCANRTAAGYTGATTPRTIHLETEMENFVANYGTPDNYYSAFGSQVTATFTNSVFTPGYGGCNIDLKHNQNDTTYDGNEGFGTGDVGTRNCISRYGARDLIGNYAEFTDGYYENLTSNTTRQKSVYWGTADRVTTVISDANLGYAVPVSVLTYYYVQDWDYQNLLPKTYLSTSLASGNSKFFMDLFWIDSTVATKINLIGYNAWAYGSHSGRFHKSITPGPTGTGTNMSARCAIVSP
jgi:hypothetical protein